MDDSKRLEFISDLLATALFEQLNRDGQYYETVTKTVVREPMAFAGFYTVTFTGIRTKPRGGERDLLFELSGADYRLLFLMGVALSSLILSTEKGVEIPWSI